MKYIVWSEKLCNVTNNIISSSFSLKSSDITQKTYSSNFIRYIFTRNHNSFQFSQLKLSFLYVIPSSTIFIPSPFFHKINATTESHPLLYLCDLVPYPLPLFANCSIYYCNFNPYDSEQRSIDLLIAPKCLLCAVLIPPLDFSHLNTSHFIYNLYLFYKDWVCLIEII